MLTGLWQLADMERDGRVFDRACARLRTDRIDVLQFHAWTFADPRWLDAL